MHRSSNQLAAAMASKSACLLRLALLCGWLLLGAARASVLPLDPLLEPVLGQADFDQPGSLLLLFAARVSAACSGRCSAVVSAAPCQPDGAAEGASLTAQLALGTGHTSVLLPRAAAELSNVTLTAECEAPCAAPAPLELWQGSGCGVTLALDGMLEALPHRLLAAANNQSVAVLAHGQAVLEIFDEPADANAQPEQEAADQPDAAEEPAQAAEEPAVAVPTQLEPPPIPTTAAHAGTWLARLFLAAWLLACPHLAAKLRHLVVR